ncbi:hypothetical protein [Streptomyces camponoticapitis]|uniref:hypothetical protein n=1 Tax=Streptomyces camponoticapitis TaxID=1616125 RepID=UPI00166E2D71|nr:hypothetical protein [Streptomyces camponoticapitis]
MSDGFVHWYEGDSNSDPAESLVGALEEAGLSLGNPSTGLISSITNGPDLWGEQVHTERDELVRSVAAVRLSGGGEVNFQFWLDGETDVFTRVRRPAGGVVTVVEFGLDGMDGAQQTQVVEAVRVAMGQRWAACLGFVIDRSGATEEEDWDGIVVDASARFTSWPDTLAMRAEIAAAHAELSTFPARQDPPLVVFERPV